MFQPIVDDKHISIHALREESDILVTLSACMTLFQSTLSVRRATRRMMLLPPEIRYFNPRSP